MADASFSPWRRAGYAALSGAAGWLAGQIVCLPLNIIVAVRDTEGQVQLFVETLLSGLLAWGLWTMLLASAVWLLVALPLVLTVRPCLLVRLRWWITIVATVAGSLLAGLRLSFFHDQAPMNVYHRLAPVIPYGLFAATFALVTTWTYILLARRRLDRTATPAAA